MEEGCWHHSCRKKDFFPLCNSIFKRRNLIHCPLVYYLCTKQACKNQFVVGCAGKSGSFNAEATHFHSLHPVLSLLRKEVTPKTAFSKSGELLLHFWLDVSKTSHWPLTLTGLASPTWSVSQRWSAVPLPVHSRCWSELLPGGFSGTWQRRWRKWSWESSVWSGQSWRSPGGPSSPSPRYLGRQQRYQRQVVANIQGQHGLLKNKSSIYLTHSEKEPCYQPPRSAWQWSSWTVFGFLRSFGKG